MIGQGAHGLAAVQRLPGRAVVGDRVQRPRLADALVLEEDDDAIGAGAVEADGDLAPAQVGGRLPARILEREGIVLLDDT